MFSLNPARFSRPLRISDRFPLYFQASRLQKYCKNSKDLH